MREGGGRTLEHVKALGCFDVQKRCRGHGIRRFVPIPRQGKRRCISADGRTHVSKVSIYESEELLDAIWKYINRIGKRTYHHEWQAGDVVIWDNRCIMHRRDAFPAASRRGDASNPDAGFPPDLIGPFYAAKFSPLMARRSNSLVSSNP